MTDKTKSNQTAGRGFRLPSVGANNAGGNAFSARGGVNANKQTGTATGQKAAAPKQSSGPAVRLSDYSGTKGYNAAKTLVSQKKTTAKPARANSWQYNADGSKKTFDQLTTGEVFAWINTLPESERGSTAAQFETEYLKNPGSTRYDPYYTNYSNNDEARALFGVDVFDQEWIDANRGYLNGVTFTDENYTTPKKPGKYASDEEKKAYAYWQIANTYEETTRNAEAEYEQLRKDIQEQVAAFKGDGTHSLTGDTLTADEVLDSIDWNEYKTLQKMREASYAGNGRYLNRPVKVGDASLHAMVNAALRGEDVTQDRDFLWDESQRLTNEEPVEAVAKAAPVSWAKTFAGAKELALGSMDERAEDLAKRIEKDAKAQAKDNEKERKEEAEDRPSFLSGSAEETDLTARIREIKARAGLAAEEPQAPAEATVTPEPTSAPMGSNRPTATPEPAATPAPTATMSQSAQDMIGVRDAEIEQLAETAAQAEEDSDEQRDIIDRLTAMIDERETISRKNAAAGNLLAGRQSAQEAVRAVQEGKAERARQAVVQRRLDEQVTEAYGTTEIEETAPVEYNEFIGSMRATSSLDATYGYVRHAIESIDTTSLEGLTNTERANLERLRGEYAEQLELLEDERAARREIEDRVMEGLENIGVGQGWGPPQFYWNQMRLDAIRDGDKVPLDDYEEYLRYRLMPGLSTAQGTVKPYDEMRAYDRYGMIESAVGYTVAGAKEGFQKGASTLSRGLEELMYFAKHKLHPEMTREELYAADYDLAYIREWNSKFEKDIIPDNVEAVADAQHPALAMMGDVLGEVVKMSTQGVAAGGIADALGGMPIVNRLITATSENGLVRSIGLQNAPFFADVFANTVDQARMEGANDDEAFMAGLLTSVISGPLSSYSADKLGNLGGRLKGLLGKTGQAAVQQGAIRAGKEGMGAAILTLMKTMGKSFASEGLEEALEEPIQSGIAKAVYDKDRAWTGEGGVFDWKAMGASGLMGGLTGSMYSVLGGLSGMLGKPAQTQAERILEKVLNGEAVTLVEQEQIRKAMDQLTGIASRAAAIEDRTADLMMEGESPEVAEAESKLQAAAESVAGLEEQQAAAQKAFDEAAARYQGVKDQFNAGTLQYTDADRAQAALDEAVKQLPKLKEDLDKANQQLEDARTKQQEADEAYNAAVKTWAAQLREQAAAEVDSEIAQENAEAQAPAEVSREVNTTGEAETFAEANNAEAQTETQMDGDLPAAKKPGVNRMFSRVLNSAQERQMQILDALGRRYGLQFDVMDDIEGANASYAGGRTISVSLNAVDQAYVQAGVHEMVHYVKRASSEGYALLEATVLNELSKNEAFDLEAAISARIEEYKGTQTLSREGAIEEIVAEAIPALFADENAVRQLVQTDRNLAQKIRDFFVEFARELRRIALGYGADSDHMEVVASISNADAGVDTLMEYAAVLDDALEMARGEMAAESGHEFSLKSIFERVRDLTAVHNLRSEALAEALKMGGMPAPSIAVVKAKDGHSMYGPISLVFKSDSIDPRQDERNRVYGSDAWTPTRDTAAASLTDGEATAEDIVQAMYESGVRKGVDYEGYQTEGLIAASAAKEYGSIRDIRRDKGRLGVVPDGEYAEKWKQLGENVQGLLSTAYKASRQAGSGVGIVDVANAMADAAREGARKPTEIADFFADRGIPIDNETARKISDAYKEAAGMPTGYFEAKPERVVGFDEVAAAIIPSDLDEGLKAQLNEMGVKTVEYEAGNEDARREALNGLEEVKFSKKADAEGKQKADTNQVHDELLTEMTGMSHDELVERDRAAEKPGAAQTDTAEFKQWFGDSKAVDENGNPRVVYHQTAGDFSVFNTNNPVAGLNDSETPNGMFFKTNDHDIGLGGDKQMAVYLKMENPLHFANRKEANAWYRKHVDGYAELAEEYDALAEKFDSEADRLNDEIFATDDEDKIQELEAEEDRLIEDFKPVEDDYRGRLRKLLDDYFLSGKSGYDGIELDYDGHRYVNGVRENVHTFIVFEPTQIKSATDNVGTFDPENPDIRYSMKGGQNAEQEHDAMLTEMTGMTHDQLIEHENAVEKQQAQNPARVMAGRVVRDYKSGIERSAVTSGFDAMMDAYQQHDDTKAQALADRLARDIIEKSVNLDRSHREQYQELINKLKTTGISLTDVQKQEVASQNDSYNAWRMRMFGSVKIKNDGTSLDAIWSELSDAAPEYFPADTNEAQMPEKLEAFVQAMRPKYVNPYGMDMDTAAADLSMRLQSDVLAVMRRKDEAAQLKQSSDAMRESAAAQAVEEERSRRKKWQRESKALADAIYKAREAGDDQSLQAALAEYRARRRRTMEGTAKADAAEIGMQIRRGRSEIARLNNLINQYEDQIKSDDIDRDRERLIDEKRQMVELREQLRQQVAHLHRQMTIDRAKGQIDGLEAAVNNEARDADDVAADLELDSAMNEILNEDTVEEIDRIRGTVRSKAEALADQMRAQGMKDYNQTSTIPMEALTQFFGDLTGDLIRTSELAKVWRERRDRADAMRKGEQRELDVLKQQLKAARSEGDQEAIATLNDLVNKQQDRVDVLESQVKLAKAQAQYMSRIGAESMQQALREGRLPQPIMEYVMAMVRESGRSGHFNQNVLVKAVETMRENATFPIRVWDDLFGEYAPIMRAIYYDPVMDNETARQKWIASWRARIDELKLTAEESGLVQMYGEGVLPDDVEVSERVKQAAEVFRAFYDEAYVMANRAMERNGYGNVNRRSKYFPHMDIPKTFLERLGITEVNSGALPTMISGMTETFSPGHQYSAHLQARKGPTTDYDALEGFEDYIGAMSGVIFHTDDIQRHRQLESEIRTMAKVEGANAQVDVHGQVYDHNHFVNWLHEYSNLLAGKKSQLDRGGEGTAGRALYKGLDLLRSTRGAGAVMGNISSAVSNAVPITQILAEHPLNTVQAAWLSMHNALHGRGNQPESQFMIRKFGSDSVVHTAYTWISNKAGKPFNFVDSIAANLVVNAYYLNNMSMGMDSEAAMRSADSKAARLMGDRSTGAAPNIYSSKILGTLVTQFQLEVANQSQHFRKDIWREKTAGKAIVQLLMTAVNGWIFNNLMEKVTGRRPATDPIDGVIEVVKTAMRGDGALSVVQAAFSNTSELFPYLGDGRVSGSAALEPMLGAAESLFSGDGNKIRDAVVNLAFSHVPGGGQLNKIRKGAIALAKGGYYNASGKQLRFPVEATDPWVVTQTLVFGPTSIEAAVDYYAGDAEGLSVAHTRNYEQARERGMTSTEAYENEAARAKAEKLQGAADEAADAAHAAERKRAAGIADTDMKDDIKNSDTSKVASQREEAKMLRSETVPTELIPDAYWDEREQPAMQNAIRIWQITGGDWVMPAIWEQDKKYTDDGEDYYIGPKVAEWANAEYKRQYDDLMSRVPDPDGLTEDQMAELKDALADIKSDISKQAKEAALYQQKGAE